MTILITGGGGYIGTVLTKTLLDAGHQVVCLDRFFFGEDKIASFASNARYRSIRGDVRTFNKDILRGVDAVIDLAALSNDPLGQLVEEKTYDINHKGRLRVCRLAKEMGVKRYVLASSCSVYGFNSETCFETSKLNPISAYAKASLKAEEALNEASGSFAVTVGRFATAFGVSPRMRFDLAINLMTLNAFKDGRIDILGQGMQWRPFVHVKDISRSLMAMVQADPSKVSGQIFNVGANSHNIRVINLAYYVREILPFEIEVRIVPDDPDKRSYCVNFDKISQVLGVKMEVSIEDGIREIYENLKQGNIWDNPDTVTVKWYKRLMEAEQLVKNIALDGSML